MEKRSVTVFGNLRFNTSAQTDQPEPVRTTVLNLVILNIPDEKGLCLFTHLPPTFPSHVHIPVVNEMLTDAGEQLEHSCVNEAVPCHFSNYSYDIELGMVFICMTFQPYEILFSPLSLLPMFSCYYHTHSMSVIFMPMQTARVF